MVTAWPARPMRAPATVLGVVLVAVFGLATSPPQSALADDPRAEVQAVFDASCVKCHGARRTSASLDLTAAASGSLAGRASTQAPSLVLVEAGKPDASYLFLKITDRHAGSGEGARMPLGGGALSDDDIDTVRRWIASGAP